MGDKNFKWWAGYGKQPESYAGPFATRDEAVTEGRARWPDGGITVLEADKSVISFSMFAADRLLEDFEEHNLECWSEDGPDICLSSEQERDLEKHLADAFMAWLDKSGEMPVAWAIGETRVEEYLPPVEAA